jgi:hypothetical protein
VKIAIDTSLFTKRYVYVNTSHAFISLIYTAIRDNR